VIFGEQSCVAGAVQQKTQADAAARDAAKRASSTPLLINEGNVE